MARTKQPFQWFIGADPGKTGGLAAVDTDRKKVFWFPATDSRSEMAEWLVELAEDDVILLIEKVSASPQMGVSSAFTFGMMYERLWAISAACNIPRDEVTPQVWQKGLGIPPRKKKTKKRKTEETRPQFKNRLLRKAKQLFPGIDLWQENLSTQKAICDALLIAEFCRRREVGQ